MRFFVVDNGLVSRLGHHCNMALGFRRELDARGIESRFYVNRKAEPDIVAALDARPVFPHTPYVRISRDPLAGPLENLFLMGRAFAKACGELEADGLTAEDLVFLPTGLQNEIFGCAIWLRDLPEAAAPRIFLNVMLDNCPGREPGKPDPIMSAAYRFAANRLLAVAAKERLHLAGHSRPFVERLRELTRLPVSEYPLPHDYGNLAEAAEAAPAARREGPLLVSLLGHSRRSKGFHLIPEIVERCLAAERGLAFFIQVCPERMARHWGGSLERLRKRPGVSLHFGELEGADYLAQLARADIVLLPYDPLAHGLSGSGVFTEALAFGKVAVATRGTWMEAQLTAGRGAGTVIADFSAAAAAAATLEAADRHAALSRAAAAQAAAWRKEFSVPGFLDRMLRELAA